jgi:hypothetical protein
MSDEVVTVSSTLLSLLDKIVENDNIDESLKKEITEIKPRFAFLFIL